MTWKCEYCGKTYKTEKGYVNHKCIFRDRYNSLANSNLFKYWLIFKKVYNIPVKKDTEKEKIALISFSQYNAFNDFVQWCNELNIYDIEEYYRYLKQFNIPLKLWTNDKHYRNFLELFINKELPVLACDRSKKYLEANGVSLNTISANRLYFYLLSGQVSKKYLIMEHFNYRNFLDKGQLADLGNLV